MSAKVEIFDGTPWWNSTDIWVIPGNDPNGPPGAPEAGLSNYLWANVHNTGTVDLTGIQVNFYWCNPTTGTLRSTSNLVGLAHVDLPAGQTKQVLCLTPWVPVVVNNGHECLIVEAVSPTDPLSSPPPQHTLDEFLPNFYHQIAQKNVQVITILPDMHFIVLPIQISAAARQKKSLTLRVGSEKLPDDGERLFHQLGIKGGAIAQKATISYGLSEKNNCSYTKEIVGRHEMEISLPPGTSKCVYLHLANPPEQKGGIEILQITEIVNKKIIGGNTIILLKN